MPWSKDIPQGYESLKIKYEIVKYTRGRGLDLGCGLQKPFPHFIGMDDGRYSPNIPDVVGDVTDLSMFSDGSMDFVFSSHCLEHIENTKAALAEWWRVLKHGGYLVLYLPHKNYYPNIGQPGTNPTHCHDFLPEDIERLMLDVGVWDLAVNENRGDNEAEYSFLQVYQKFTDPVDQAESYRNPRPKKTCGIVRYGGFGDCIQTAALFPGLKAQGYHITLYTTQVGYDMLKTDPYLDEFYLQDKDQVPNVELGPFWNHQKKKYDRWVNLSESVEGTFLALPGRINHTWPHHVRNHMMNENYLEFACMLADVPYRPVRGFYPTDEEKEWAEREYGSLGAKVILWCLSGSSVHKTWPWLDQMLARIMLTYPEWKVVLVGDELCKILEYSWENEPRVVRRSGEWSIRQTLTFAEQCDMVIGPETGVLNHVAFLPIHKIITLSHSSRNNLSRDWVNCISLTPKDCRCYPCHMMHYSFEHCTRDEETGVALCQARIGPEVMWDSITKHIRVTNNQMKAA